MKSCVCNSIRALKCRSNRDPRHSGTSEQDSDRCKFMAEYARRGNGNLNLSASLSSYSARRASMGLILVARLAGIHAAAMVITVTAEIAMEIAVGSSGLNS